MAEVLWVDRFGNVQLNVGPDDVDSLGPRVLVRWGGRDPHRRAGRRLRTRWPSVRSACWWTRTG